MKRILILGGYGYTGKLLTKHLLEESKVQIILAGRSLEKAQALAAQLNDQFNGKRVTTLRVDAADSTSLRAALSKADFLLVAAPTTKHTETVIHAALEAGVDYLDVQLGAKKFEALQAHAEEIRRQKLCFVTEAGFHPGMGLAMVRYAAAHLDSIQSAILGGFLNLGKNLPYTEAVDELIEIFKDYQAQVYRKGQWTKSSSFDMRRIDFGGDIGKKLCYSMFFEELRPLPEMYPTLKEAGFYMSESHWVTDWVIMPLVWAWLKVAPCAVRPIGRFLWWGMGTFLRPPYRVELQVQASGLKNGKQAQFRSSVAHPDGYELTAIPVVAYLLQYLDGSARRPGLWMMGQLIEPQRFMKEIEKMGAKVSTLFN